MRIVKMFFVAALLGIFSNDTLLSQNADSLVAYYLFTNGSAADSSGNGNDGTVNGATSTTDRFGNPNSAFSFDGVNDEISCQVNNALSNFATGDHSLSVWANMSSQANALKFLVDYGGNNRDQEGIRINSSNVAHLKWVTDPAVAANVYDTQAISTNKWYHIVGVVKGSTGNLYIDGKLIATQEVSQFPNTQPISLLKIGNISGGGTGNGFVNAVLDDIKLFSKALTSKEIDSLYLVGGWPLDIAPQTPQNLTATAGNQQITLTWSPNGESDLAKYNIYETTDTTAGFNLLASVTAPDTNYTQIGLANGSTYFYKLASVDSAGNESGYSDVVSATPNFIAEGLIAFYPFTNGTAADSSGYRNDGTVNGSTPTIDRFGNENSAFSFDGVNDFITVSNSYLLEQPEALTIIAWVKTSVNSTIISRYNVSNGRQWALGTTQFNVQEDLNSFNRNTTANFEDTTLFQSDWHMIAGTWSSLNKAKIYFDGILIGTAQSSVQNIEFKKIAMLIGKTTSDSYLKGKIDDIRIYSSVLSLNEIDSLYHVGGWPLDIAPQTPQNLTATPGNQQITITWSPNTESDLTKYNIYSTTDTTAGFSLLASVTAPDTIYTHTGLTNGTTYYYKLTAVDSTGNESGYSDIISVTPNLIHNGLVLYFPFDKDVNDHSGNENEVIGHNISWKAFNGVDTIASFNGSSSFIEVINTPQLVPDTKLTITGWIFLETNSVGNIVYKLDASENGYQIRISNQKLELWNGNHSSLTSNSSVELNKMTQFAVIYDSGTAKIYLDNVMDITGSLGGNLISDANLFIGRHSNQSGYFKGFIGELAIYYRVLLDVELDSLYNYYIRKLHPDIPQNLTATPGKQQITLTWSPNTESDLEKYNIYETTDTTAGFSLFASVTAPDTSYIHTSIQNGTKYYYRISAVDTAGNESDLSDVVSETPMSLPVSPVLIYPLSADEIMDTIGTIDFIWSKTENTDNYRIQISPTVEFDTLSVDRAEISDTTVTLKFADKIEPFYWRVNGGNIVGEGEWSDSVYINIVITKIDDIELPKEYRVYQNYPNPFNPSTIIKFGIPEQSNVKLTLYNLLGQRITELVNGEKSPGYYEVQFDASNISSGIYIYRLEASSKEKSFVQVKKMILMK